MDKQLGKLTSGWIEDLVTGEATMGKSTSLLLGALGLLVCYVAVKNIPDIIRYIKISRM